jgi:hypothetical protein
MGPKQNLQMCLMMMKTSSNNDDDEIMGVDGSITQGLKHIIL